MYQKVTSGRRGVQRTGVYNQKFTVFQRLLVSKSTVCANRIQF